MYLIGYLLVLIHLFLFLWSAGGFAELIFSKVPWTPFTNPDFPKWLLPIHWGSVMIASTGFLFGYFSGWRKTPEFMLATYTMLFTICVIETFGFMSSPTKYMAMGAEFVTYTLLLTLLFKHQYFTDHFGRQP